MSWIVAKRNDEEEECSIIVRPAAPPVIAMIVNNLLSSCHEQIICFFAGTEMRQKSWLQLCSRGCRCQTAVRSCWALPRPAWGWLPC